MKLALKDGTGVKVRSALPWRTEAASSALLCCTLCFAFNFQSLFTSEISFYLCGCEGLSGDRKQGKREKINVQTKWQGKKEGAAKSKCC